jgi:hypothetical protein
MNDTIRVFVNAGAVDVPAGSDVGAAVRAFDPAIERRVAEGTAYVTDGRGIELSTGARLAAGAILRIILSSPRSANVDADA